MIGERGGALLACACALIALSPTPARADIAIAAPSCDALDLAELERLLDVEIADVSTAWSDASPPVVLLGCSGDRVRIEITDPITDKSVTRTIALPSEDRERVLALAIAQLFVTSWLELLIDADAGATPGAEAAERIARSAIAEASAEAEPAAETESPTAAARAPEAPSSPPLRSALELALEGGARVRFDGENVATAAAAFRLALVIDESILVGARLGGELSRVTRMRGDIDVYDASLGVGGGWRSPSMGAFHVDLTGWVSAMWLMLQGRPRSADVEAGATIAIVAEAFVEAAPSLRLGPAIVSLALGLGGIAFAPQGEVTEEPPVIVGGPFFSATLRVGLVPSAM